MTRAFQFHRVLAVAIIVAVRMWAAEVPSGGVSALALPADSFHQLQILSPSVLELTLVQTKALDPSPLTRWNFAVGGPFQAPATNCFEVRTDAGQLPVKRVGFKRRPVFAPLLQRDLRVTSVLYLELSEPAGEGANVTVLNPDGTLWPANWTFSGRADRLRHSPAIHVNQAGYMPGSAKKAMVGCYLGSLGELVVNPESGFTLVDVISGQEVFHGVLKARPDQGLPYPAYQKVFEADFTGFHTPGEYRLVVPGLGASLPFRINDGVVMNFTRAYALGLYHQRCGTGNTLPYTRHTHDPCHTAPAEVPLPGASFPFTWGVIAQETANAGGNPRHTAPRLRDEASQLYPFVNRGPLDVSGGHHDAGDYSKYTINSAGLIHHLMFAVDSLPGAAALDNLGLPESGDGVSDLLQEARWEAEFLAKMQDADGGFYFLVYPRNRRYEDNVLPDQGDPQVVWPKNTAATAAAVAALAQCASSPRYKQHYPADAARYLEKARLGWSFLTNAIAIHGKDGAYQKITHYGDNFMHDDELAWAACEMYLATRDPACHQRLKEWYDPSDANTRRWGWWRMAECFGNAARSYAFASRSGRLSAGELDASYAARCETEIAAAGMDGMHWSGQSAYGTSFPSETKRVRAGGWYFSLDRAFDIVVAAQLDYPPTNDPRPQFAGAFLANLNYEGGCNPLNVSYLTGLGGSRQREIVHQYAHNDRRTLPPSGLPVGNIQSAMPYLDLYKSELGALIFPGDNEPITPYPIYDRWIDAHNVSTEFVIVNQARSLAGLAHHAAQTPLRTQEWSFAAARITGLPATETSTNIPVTASFNVTGLDMTDVIVIWEARGQEPAYGSTFTFAPRDHGSQWVEMEATWPDGRRAFAATNFFATNGLPVVTVAATTGHLDESRPLPGTFLFHRTGGLDASLAVTYRLSGTAAKWGDYRTLKGDMPEFVVIPAGVATFALEILPVSDGTVEGPESVVLALSPAASYNVGAPNTAQLWIADDDLGILSIKKKPQASR